ncbi:hypothetical protein [Bythopirellula polymerisocia]|uniref:Uncharacterized protein n=1 Tax=Bythopirellula polymerisocia TaxID=2528003 RepID=A0A5C6CAZ5_9BACT|nr:hypothetical protein [Bythopirellula polymerisocia]TWU21923.1 hypothetical protein Pla144_43900 [Bythopirellula polymerisocia]
MFDCRRLRTCCADWVTVIVLFSLPLDSVWAADQQIDSLLGDPASYWSPAIVDSSTEELHELPLIEDSNLELAQMLAPQRRPGMQLAQRQQSSSDSSRDSGLSSVPFMIGDTGAGACLSYGSFLDVDLGHPTMACSRLNISEANTPLPTDRVYFSYRHFENATPTRVFDFSEDFNIDRFTLAGEKTFFDRMMSMEIRMPLDYRLNSQIGSYAVNPFDQTVGFAPGFDPLFGFNSDRRVELGNISMIFKALLCERENYAISAGLGVTLPTARDVTYDATIDEYITFTDPDLLARYAIQISSIASNETVYLSPYLAWVVQPTERFFHQGFMQVEVAANSSFFTVGGGGLATYDTNGSGTVSNNFPEAGDTQYGFITPFPIGVGKIIPQTLMRLNLGWGYVLAEDPNADFIQRLSGLFEVHYTTTLNDASLGEVPLVTVSGSSITGFDTITVGNRNNRVDIVNLVGGVSANVGNWVITNGITAPVTTGTNRGFDFEYNLQLQRIF